MIEFFSESSFALKNQKRYRNWITSVVKSEGKKCGDISYIFCDDAYLNAINKDYLNHEDFTDIISFDYCEGEIISGDIFISTERVKENATKFLVEFDEELRRVLVHGILHYCGYKDKTEEDSKLMRKKEEEKMGLFHVEQF